MRDLNTDLLTDIAAAQRAGDSATLLALLDRERSTGHATRVLRALGRIGDPKALPPTISYLHSDEREVVELYGWEAVGGFGPPAVEPLLEAARGGNYAARCGAVSGLARAASESDAKFLAPVVADPNRAVRLRAASTLHRIGGETGTRLLARLVNDPVRRNRRVALRLLLATPGPLVADALKEEVPHLKSPTWRWWVRWRSRRLGSVVSHGPEAAETG